MAIWTTNNFTGGMNNYIHPSLLQPNTAAFLEDVRIDNGKIKPVLRNGIYGNGSTTNAEALGHHASNNRSAVKWYDRWYWSYNNATVSGPFYGTDTANYGGPNVPWQSSLGSALGVPHVEYAGSANVPSFTTDTAGTGETGLSGDYKYCITLVDWNGYEGAPGSLESYWKEVTVSDKVVVISIASMTLPANVHYAKVWRTIDHGADFYLVGTLSNETVDEYIVDNDWVLRDTMSDSILLMRSPLTSTDNDLPPNGGKYLCESNGVFFLAVGSRLYFSRQDNPHAWPTLNFIGFDDVITGIAPEFSGVLVFTNFSAWRVTGAESQETISRTLIPGNHGCPNYHSISAISNAPIWVSQDGICLWNGESIEVVTHQRLSLPPLQIIAAASMNDKYYLFLATGTIVYDRKNNGVFYWLSLMVDYAWHNELDDKLYFEVGSFVYIFEEEGTPLPWSYLSPYIGGTEMVQRIFRQIIVASDQQTVLTVYLEDENKLSVVLPAGRNKVKLPLNFVGRWLQMRLTGKGELSELAVIYGGDQ